ncbi:hypothetical protein [Thaumasiovibrio sp. DFM-14]|uniref:hypothetical protein n=1 Tax=Thaumasiovibrio sp. DFM-14 TaxID=3384792 RepID=UPI0039A0E15A
MSESGFPELIDTVEAFFGTTNWVSRGGYILPDGRLLDLKRSDQDKKLFHHVVISLLPTNMRSAAAEVSIIRLMAETGIIRYEPRGRAHLATMPTPAQRQRLFQIIKYSQSPFQIFISHTSGVTLAQKTFHAATAYELLQFYESAFAANSADYWCEEFSLLADTTQWRLLFRPSQQIVGVRLKRCGVSYMDAEFLAFESYFHGLIAKQERTSVQAECMI